MASGEGELRLFRFSFLFLFLLSRLADSPFYITYGPSTRDLPPDDTSYNR
jgi:hypothetical protein